MQIVHRDVNPRNVMVSTFGEVKLIDFGVARAAERLERTETNTVKGKFAYMAPEQIEGQAALDGRADLYAVGLMLHELLTGRSPFVGLSDVQILHRIMSGRIPALPDDLDVPGLAALRAVHARALAMRVEERYPDADAFREDLEATLGALGGLAPARVIASLLEEATGDRVREITERLRNWHDGDLASFGGSGTMVPERSVSQSRPSSVSVAGLAAQGAAMTAGGDTQAWGGESAGTGERFGTAVVATPVRATPVGPPPSSPEGSEDPTLREGLPTVQELAARAAATEPAKGAGAAKVPTVSGSTAPAAPPAAPRWPAAVLVAAVLAIAGAGAAVWRHRAPEPSSRPARVSNAARVAPARTPAPSTAQAPEPSAPSAGSPAAASAPRVAPVRTDSAGPATRGPVSATQSPIAPADPAAPSPAPTAPAPPEPTATAPVTEPAPTPATATPRAAERPGPGANPGLLNVSVRGGTARVYLDGTLLGPAPRRGERVAPGRHVVRVESPDSGRSSTREVVVEPGFNPPLLFDAP
jgi:hypothetical protein